MTTQEMIATMFGDLMLGDLMLIVLFAIVAITVTDSWHIFKRKKD